MAAHRLVAALEQLEPDAIDRVFGHEADLFCREPAPSVLAPVRRVALVTESFYPKMDGVAKSAYLTLRYLQQTGREVMVIAPDIAPPQVGPSRVRGVASVGLPFAPETRVALPLASVGKHLEAFQPDLVHLFSPAVMSAQGVRYGQRHHVPVIANYQTDLPAYAHHYGMGAFAPTVTSWLRAVHNRADLTLVPSQFTLRQLREQGYRGLRVWKRGVDLDRFSPANRSPEMRAKLLAGRPDDALLCLYVGRIASEKRIDLLLDIARVPGVALTIVGDGAAREDLETLFAGTDTVFTGYLYGDDLAAAYASADAFTFPGPSETFGQVVQEAMASGLPCVVIDQGGVSDLVTHGASGFVCSADPAAFAEAVGALLSHPDLRLNMARRARADAEQRPWSAIMAQLEDYYREAIAFNYRLVNQRFRPQRPSLVQRFYTRVAGRASTAD
ncbi:MAG TPA: glycosyltransferase family 1 protein [Aggregatilinea sp.]|uniref:glycosyltransferase family 4 protein n=1 Tax=Aggregatilinea sp. TaxID=2806333 RepID=UPI002CDA2B96|nr:glycosyltransferase family 1 protein [Aggregatilinea sp.]HML23742.1 glycosyltransferase family 1 protein [Aggregatilinea sp.]